MILDLNNLYVWPFELQFHEKITELTSGLQLTGTVTMPLEEVVKTLIHAGKMQVKLVRVNELVTDQRMEEVKKQLLKNNISSL